MHLSKLLVCPIFLALTAIGQFAWGEKFALFPAHNVDLEQILKDKALFLSPRADVQHIQQQMKVLNKEFHEIINQRLSTNPFMNFQTIHGGNPDRSGARVELKIESLYKRPNIGSQENPNNWIEAYFNMPTISNDCLANKIPGTLILQHIRDRIDLERRVARLLVGWNTNDEQAALVISFPQYGKRKDLLSSFLSPNLKDLRTNFLQALLDIHVAYSFLRSRPNIHPDQINLYGTSLGAIVGFLASGFNPVFNRYSFLAGGGNLFEILTKRMSITQGRDIGRDLETIQKIPHLREELIFLDPVMWSSYLKNSEIQILHAQRDEIISHEKSVKPLLDDYVRNENRVKFQWLQLGHGVDLGWQALIEIFFPIKAFLAGAASGCGPS